MHTRKLRDIEVSAIGMGCMGFTHGYGAAPSEGESIRLMRKAFDSGCTFYDTAEAYSAYANEELVGRALKPIRDKVATDRLDLYYVHRIPAGTDMEELAGTFGELAKEGKILAWGLSEATAGQIRRAHAVFPLSAVQSEYSIMERKWEREVIPLCGELRIGFVAYSPMAGGFLSGKYGSDAVYEGDDVRRVITRYAKENVEANAPLVGLLKKYAAQKGATPAQIALAWILRKGGFIVPIPGMRSDGRIAENLGASDVELSDGEFFSLESELGGIEIRGDRRDEDIARLGTIARPDGG